MGRRFIFPRSNDRVRPSTPAAPHVSGFGITASEGAQPEKLAKTSKAEIDEARDWLKSQGLDDAVAMFDASMK